MTPPKLPEWRVVNRFSDIRGPMTEAICEHGIGHHDGVHGCDGCCKDMPKVVRKKVTRDEE